MKSTILTILFFAFFSCNPTQEVYENSICITNVSIIDAEQGLQEGMTVIVQRNRIFKVDKSEKFNLAATNQIIDGLVST